MKSKFPLEWLHGFGLSISKFWSSTALNDRLKWRELKKFSTGACSSLSYIYNHFRHLVLSFQQQSGHNKNPLLYPLMFVLTACFPKIGAASTCGFFGKIVDRVSRQQARPISISVQDSVLSNDESRIFLLRGIRMVSAHRFDA